MDQANSWDNTDTAPLIRLTQFLAGLTASQDVWHEIGRALITFFGVDRVAFGERREDGAVVTHHWTYPGSWTESSSALAGSPVSESASFQKDMDPAIREAILETLESGFITTRQVNCPEPVSMAFLPVTDKHRVPCVMIIGQRGPGSFTQGRLHMYLAIAGMVGTTVARLNSEKELRRHRRNPEEWVEARTVELTEANRRLHQEIAQRKQAEEDLGESRHRFRQIIEFLPDATFVVDREGRVMAWNRAIEDLTGVQASDMLGKGNYEYAIPFYHERRPVMIDLVISDDHSLDHMYAYVKRDRERYESESFIPHLKPGGAYLFNTARALYDAEGRLMGAIESIRDITDAKKIQLDLEASRSQLAEIIDFFPDPLFVINTGSRVVAWNRAMEELTGIRAETIIGKGDYEYAIPFYGERRPILIDLALSWDEKYRETYLSVHRREDGVLMSESYHPDLQGGIYLSGTARVFRDAYGQPQWAIENLRDISAIKEVEENLKASRGAAEEASRAKSEFLATMSHEIRTPLNGVIGMAGLLLGSRLTDTQRRYAEIIHRSGEALIQIVSEILDFSKIEAGRLDLESLDFDLYSLMDDVTANLAVRAQEKGLELVCGINPDVPARLCGDPGRLRQILTNLIGNAVKFTRQGEVAVRVSLEAGGAESVQLGFEVRDTGIGISSERISMIFEKFTQADASTTRQYGGTGLGLAITKELVGLMGGTIGAESQVGEGSRFWFSLPFERQPGVSSVPAFSDVDMRGARVLIVEHNETNREVLTLRLKAWEMRPAAAMNGTAGLVALLQARQEGDPFRIVLVDMQMPSMDGEAFCRAVKGDDRVSDTPLVLLTSLAVRGEARRVRDMGFSGYLTKPVSHSDLFDVLNQVMSGRDAPAKSMVTRHSAREFKRLKGRSGARILLVEDNITNQQVALDILENLGLRTDAAANGVEALKSLETIPYDLILMDVEMPEMDGLEATRRIRALEAEAEKPDGKDRAESVRVTSRSGHIPIVAMTAHALAGHRERCLEAGMDDYISKPVNPQALAKVLDRWLPVDLEEVQGRHEDEKKTAAIHSPQAVRESDVAENEPSVFDRACFMERVMGEVPLAGRVIAGFLEDVPRRMETLSQCIDAGDAEALRREAHTIKGAAANMCAEVTRGLAFELEKAGEANDLSLAEDLMPRLKGALEALREVLNETLRDLDPQGREEDG